MEIEESGMLFQLDDDNCFHIEKHSLADTNCKNSTRNNKVCEFITFAYNCHVFVEAKSSAPKCRSGRVSDLMLYGKSMPKNWTAFDNYTSYLRDIAQKFIDSLSILHALSIGCHGEKEALKLKLPEFHPNKSAVEFVLILNIPSSAGNVARESLSPLRDALVNEMRPFLKTWNISTESVKIFWPEQAQLRYNFLSDIS